MSINSVNTNTGAMIALQSLNATNQQLAVTQKQISTGYRVADASDDGAAFAIAQNIRSTVGALTTSNQQLGNVQGLLSTTENAMTDISKTMSSMHDVLTRLADQNVSGNQRSEYVTQYNSYASQVQTFIQDASYNGKTLIGNMSTATGSFGSVNVVRNDAGAQYAIASAGQSALYGSLATTIGAAGNLSTSTSVKAFLTAGGTFTRQQNQLGLQLNTVGSEINYVSNQVTYNNNKIDALNTGLGALIDADLAKESAQLTSLQIRQQLGTQALSMANQAPSTLMSLFR